MCGNFNFKLKLNTKALILLSMIYTKLVDVSYKRSKNELLNV